MRIDAAEISSRACETHRASDSPDMVESTPATISVSHFGCGRPLRSNGDVVTLLWNSEQSFMEYCINF